MSSHFFSLFEKSEYLPDVIVVGLQEVVKIRLLDFFNGDKREQNVLDWIEILKKCMNQVNFLRNVNDQQEQYTFFQ